MAPDAHPNDAYVDPTSRITGPPVPPVVFPDELAAQQAPDQSTAQVEGGASSGTGSTEENVRDDAPADYSDTEKFSAEDLEKLVEDRELEVTGTGQNGNVLRADREKALADDDAAKVAEQS